MIILAAVSHESSVGSSGCGLGKLKTSLELSFSCRSWFGNGAEGLADERWQSNGGSGRNVVRCTLVDFAEMVREDRSGIAHVVCRRDSKYSSISSPVTPWTIRSERSSVFSAATFLLASWTSFVAVTPSVSYGRTVTFARDAERTLFASRESAVDFPEFEQKKWHHPYSYFGTLRILHFCG